ncbi:hypothetical protein PHLCEN_2v2368 [Hermanssonia centrifuga]|uniref:Uncharacterized protein n=1 Tax=Hermanssonia centrifuga TaxID=98765 RepID=A0A2R6RLY6_9APHY|nr:hypothetical protein PHLCEN_2v2368 [Hermanssonia centrifuga]
MPSVLAAIEEAWQAPGTRVEFFLQVFDNAYICISVNIASYASKLRGLFWIASSSFVFPVMLSLAQIIFLYVASDDINLVYVTLLFYVNDIVEIVCALVATLLVVGNSAQEAIDLEKMMVISLPQATRNAPYRSFSHANSMGEASGVEFESYYDTGSRTGSCTPSFIQ